MKFFDMLKEKEVAEIIEPKPNEDSEAEPEIDVDGEGTEGKENGNS